MKKSILSKSEDCLTVFDTGVSTDCATFEARYNSIYINVHEEEEQSTVELDIEAVPELIQQLEKWYDEYRSKNILRYQVVSPTVESLLETLQVLQRQGRGHNKVIMFDSKNDKWKTVIGFTYGENDTVNLLHD